MKTLMFRNVSLVRDKFKLEVSEVFQNGELTVVLGPSGCGKTTLLDLAAGFLKPDTGRIFEGESDVTEWPPHRRRIGVVFQEHTLFPHMSILKNVCYGPLSRGESRSKAKSRSLELLSLMNMEDKIHRRPATLSGGERQRAALGRALAIEPDILLLDEPFNALDAAMRRRLRSETKNLQHRTGVTTILVTHDQEEALMMADRLAIMKDGRLRQIGKPREIWEEPKDLFTALFLGRSSRLPVSSYSRGMDGRLLAHSAAGTLYVTENNIPEGTNVVVFRPEALEGVPKSAAGPGILKARIVESEYVGGIWKIKAEAGDCIIEADSRDAPKPGDHGRWRLRQGAGRILSDPTVRRV